MSSLFWAVMDNEQKKKTEEILATFDKDSKDEMGLMSITIALSNKMFPGTSVLHTRLRYVFLIGWIFLESLKNREISRESLHKNEKKLRKILQEEKDKDKDSFIGILGSTKIIDEDGDGDELSQPPFSIYFNLLKEWDIITDKDLSVTELHRDSFCSGYLSILKSEYFKNDTFKLSNKEAEYILKKVPESILLTILKQEKFDNEKSFVDFDIDELENSTQGEIFENAQKFSLLMWGSMLFYDYYLGNDSDRLKENFKTWKSRAKDIVKDWEPKQTLEIVKDKVNSSQRNFINNWFKYVQENIDKLSLENPPRIKNMEVEEFLLKREQELKGDRSRLLKKQNGENFKEAKFGINPIEYRWSNILIFKKDFDNATR